MRDESHERLTLLDEFATAWNRHDVDALMSMMTDDCVFDASAGPDVAGTLVRLTERVERRALVPTSEAERGMLLAVRELAHLRRWVAAALQSVTRG